MSISTEIKAGPELDAEIARRVFGLDIVEMDGWARPRYQDDTGQWHSLQGDRHAYSTDIAAAWLVVEKMREQPWPVMHAFAMALAPYVPDNVYDAIAELLIKLDPERICRAALAALESSE